MIDLNEGNKGFIANVLHMRVTAWKVMLSGIIILISGVYIFLKTDYESSVHELSMFVILLGFYIMGSTLIKMYSYFKYNIEY